MVSYVYIVRNYSIFKNTSKIQMIVHVKFMIFTHILLIDCCYLWLHASTEIQTQKSTIIKPVLNKFFVCLFISVYMQLFQIICSHSKEFQFIITSYYSDIHVLRHTLSFMPFDSQTVNCGIIQQLYSVSFNVFSYQYSILSNNLLQ